MSLQIQDGHWYERRDGKIVQAKPKVGGFSHVALAFQYDADGNEVGGPVFWCNGMHNSGCTHFPDDLIREVPHPTKMTLHVGGKYRRRDGEVVTIDREQRTYSDGQLVYAAGPRWYLPDGTTYYEEYRETQNIVAEVLSEPPAKLSLKVGDRCLTRGGKEVVLTATPSDHRHAKSHPLQYGLDNNLWTVRTDGVWCDNLLTLIDDRDIVSVLPPLEPPPFRITAGEYYTTRDGRCAYVACGPVGMPESYKCGPAIFGTIESVDGDDYFDAMCWEEDGTEYGEEIGVNDSDLVALWSPPPYVCPHTGKTYNLVEATA